MLTFKSREQNKQSVQIESESLLKAELPINVTVTRAFVTVFGDLVNASRTSNYSDVILPEKDHIPK